ncbi:MAG: insulinase family protein [Desulfuromonas sp.]|nr:MAG: insulinase family protein [Desulfuromonas sp.]
MQIYQDQLANGLRLVTVDMPHLHSVEMVCYIGAGARHESHRHSGISHFLEHMLFRGNDLHPSSLALERAFEAVGGAVNAATDSETTCYFSRLHPDALAEGTKLFAALLRTPHWNDIDIERRVILEEALEDLSESGEMINPDVLTNRLFWPGHPLSEPTVGRSDSLANIDRSALAAYHHQHYVPSNTVVTMAGRISHEQALAAIGSGFSDWTGEKPAPPLAAPELPEGGHPASVWVSDSCSQVSLQLAVQLPGRRNDDAFPMRIWRRILSWGGASRLMLKLREELGLTYHVEANLSLLDEVGCLTIDLALQPDSLAVVVEEVLKQLSIMVREAVQEEELQRVKRNFRFDIDYSRDHAEDLAVRYGWGQLVGYVRTLEDELADIDSITSSDLQRVAERCLVPGRVAMAVVGPWREKERIVVEELLAGWQPS